MREKQEAKGVDFCVATWLDSAAKRASQISVATHVLKYANSDAKGTNVYLKRELLKRDVTQPYITTDTLSEIPIDIVGNAAAMDIASLLNLKVNEISLLDLIVKGDFSPLMPFADSESRLSSWMEGLKSILSEKELSSHTLAKQIYFPVGEGEYHLLAPLYASSLSHVLYERVNGARFGENEKVARKCKKEGEYSDIVVVDFPNLAIQKFGGTKPLNISRLNSLRGGSSFLLRSVPPVWETVKRPPIRKNGFWSAYEKETFKLVDCFKSFLNTVKRRDSNKEIRIQVQDYVDRLLDQLIAMAAEIQAMSPGWSTASEIPVHEQLWLDPFREDFNGIDDDDWMRAVSDQFASWITHKLKGKDNDLEISDLEHKILSDKCLKVIKEVKE